MTASAQSSAPSCGIKRYPTRGVSGHEGKKVYEHTLIAERALGRPLPRGAVVHHVDGNKANNANTNLVICQDEQYHHLLHIRARIWRAGGNPDTDKLCGSCKKPKPLAEFHPSRTLVSRRANRLLAGKCRDCNKSYMVKYRRERRIA